MTERVLLMLASLAVALLVLSPARSQVDAPDGAALYARYCASCHGRFGEGDGPVADAIAVNIPNLRTLSARSAGRFPRDGVMRYIDGRDVPNAHGDRLMPVWGETFSIDAADTEAGAELARRRIAAITAYIEQLQN